MGQTILIVEDDKDLRENICSILQNEGFQTTEAQNGTQALDKLLPSVSLVILDIMMPGISGIETCQQIRSFSYVPILFLTARSSESNKAQGLYAGGDDYLTKPFSVLELAARIRSLLRRSKKDERMIQIHSLCIDLDKRTVSIDEHPVELTFKEFELLKYLAKNEGRAVSREELINQIWGYDFIGESRTLDVHINSLRKKIGSEYAHWIQSVRQVGYRFVVGDSDA